MGDPNASIPTPQPVFYRPMFGAAGKARHDACITFVSKIAAEQGLAEKLGLQKRVLPVEQCRSISKKDMRFNDAAPLIEVDSETYEVRVDGLRVDSAPAQKLSLAQLYNLF
jgi:urease subunit alpha